MAEGEIILELSSDVDLDTLNAMDEHTFQIHVLPDGRLKLVPVILDGCMIGRCPVLIGGEQCGKQAGHSGKHCWARGD